MAKLKRDERACPYCAETIKASAIKCRFCQSDIEPIPEPVPEPEPVDRPLATSSARSVSEAKGLSPRALLTQHLTLVLALLVLLAGAGVGALWWRAETTQAAVAPNGALVGETERTDVLVAAADLAQRTLSYDHKTLDNDIETARGRMTPAFREEYDATMEQVRANTEKNEIVLQAVAVSSAIIDATEDQARTLVFVNQTTTAGTGEKANQQLTRSSLLLTLVKQDGEWVVSKLESLG